MKTTRPGASSGFAVLLLLLSTSGYPLSTLAQGTAFTYQGRLNDGAVPANGTYDLRFAIYDTDTPPGVLVGNPITNTATGVTNGLFTVTLDFGTGIFTGLDRWLEVGVRTNSAGAFAGLSPRQKIMPAPYAITAVSLASVVANNVVNTAAFATVGGGYGNDSDGAKATIGGGYQNTNSAPYGTIGGGYQNFSSAGYSTVAGGAQNTNTGSFGTVSGGYLNASSSDYATVSGGRQNIASGFLSTVSGGGFNHAIGIGSFIGGGGTDGTVGLGNIASGLASVISGGAANNSLSNYDTVGGGYGNVSSGSSSTVGGGYSNTSSGPGATIGGGSGNTSGGTYATVSGGVNNSATTDGGTVGGGNGNQVSDLNGTVGGGVGNSVNGNAGTIAGGAFSVIEANTFQSTIGGGLQNLIWTDANQSTIGGGNQNLIHGAAAHATIGGGYVNVIETNAYNSTIAGGDDNTIGPFAVSSVLGGGSYNWIQQNAQHSVLDGGEGNLIQTNSMYSTIGGGHVNTIQSSATESTIGGGFENTAGGIITNIAISGATIAGGVSNRADCAYTFIGGGKNNVVNDFLFTFIGRTLTASPCAVIAGGEFNSVGAVPNAPTAPANHSAIGGGYANAVQSASQSVISGGGNNIIYSGSWSAIPGGQNNEVDGAWSLAAGRRAKAYNNGTFIWADSQNADFGSTGDNQFDIRAQGGVHLNTDTGVFFGSQTRQMLNLWDVKYGIGVQAFTEYFRSDSDFSWFKGGVHNDAIHNPGGGTELMRLDAGGNLNVRGTVTANSVILTSDRNAKENFEPISCREILDEVTALPVARWNYKTEAATRHIGPMAQDFYAAFHVGSDDKHIAVVDEGGVALAAIQGLNHKLSEELNRRDAENAELQSRLSALEKLVANLSQKGN